MSTFKTQWRLSTQRDLHTQDGEVVPEGTRVIVMSSPSEDTVKVKVEDPALPSDLQYARVVAGNKWFARIPRGRPRKSED